MIITANTLLQHEKLREHAQYVLDNRGAFNARQENMQREYGSFQFAANAGLPSDFWRAVDNTVVEATRAADGYEILEYLQPVQVVQSIGATVRQYVTSTDIADEVVITMSGHGKHGFDHTGYETDGDPVPMFRSGFGANWRHVVGLRDAGLDLILDSQRAKLIKHNKALVSYALNGSAEIVVDGKPGQGLKNHRNTVKIDLDASGANIDLTTATAEQWAVFLTTGAFGTSVRTNKVTKVDRMYVSYEIYGNLLKPYVVNGALAGTSLTAIGPWLAGMEVVPTYALVGNEFLAISLSKQYVSPIIAMATNVTPIPRQLPEDNYSFRILTGMGMQVKKDGDGHAGIFYGGNFA